MEYVLLGLGLGLIGLGLVVYLIFTHYHNEKLCFFTFIGVCGGLTALTAAVPHDGLFFYRAGVIMAVAVAMLTVCTFSVVQCLRRRLAR